MNDNHYTGVVANFGTASALLGCYIFYCPVNTTSLYGLWSLTQNGKRATDRQIRNIEHAMAMSDIPILSVTIITSTKQLNR
jgi:hypothetical protein